MVPVVVTDLMVVLIVLVLTVAPQVSLLMVAHQGFPLTVVPQVSLLTMDLALKALFLVSIQLLTMDSVLIPLVSLLISPLTRVLVTILIMGAITVMGVVITDLDPWGIMDLGNPLTGLTNLLLGLPRMLL